MYISKVDAVIERELDTFYEILFSKKNLPIITKILKQHQNFIQYQTDINELIFINNIGKKDLAQLFNEEDKISYFTNVVRRYNAIYLFLTIAFYSDAKFYANNVIEFGRLQDNVDSKYKIKNFFNSENNGILVKYFVLIKDALYLLGLNPAQLNKVNKDKYKDSADFLNELGVEFVSKNLANLHSPIVEKRTIAVHHLVKSIIYKKIYHGNDKNIMIQSLEEIEKTHGEYRYIDIITSKESRLNLFDVEEALPLPQNIQERNLIDDTYELLTHVDPDLVSIDEKIERLFNIIFVLPITSDFLRFHDARAQITEIDDLFIKNKFTEEYLTSQRTAKKKDITKIQYIVNKIENVAELYSDTVKKNKTIEDKIKTNYISHKNDKNSVTYNEIEELKLLKKLNWTAKKDMYTDEYYLNLQEFRLYPYINFKNYKEFGFGFTPNKNTRGLRYNNIEQKKSVRKFIELRMCIARKTTNIIGLSIMPNEVLDCLTTSRLTDIRKIPWAELFMDGDAQATEPDNNDGFSKITYFISNYIINRNDNKWKNKIIYWIFNPLTDDMDEGVPQNNSAKIKETLEKVYDSVVHDVLEKVKTSMEGKNQYDGKISLRHINDKYITLDGSKEFSKYSDIIYQNLYDENKIKDLNIDDRKKINKIISLPIYKHTKIDEPTLMKIDLTDFFKPKFYESNKNEVLTIKENLPAQIPICQHNIEWKQIRLMHTKGASSEFLNITLLNTKISAFIDKYVANTDDNDFICKSCSDLINIKHYIKDGYFDNSQQKYVSFYVPLDVELESLPEYSTYGTLINNMKNILDKFALMTGIKIGLSEEDNKQRKKYIIKNVIDLINFQFKHQYEMKRSDYSSFVFFDINDQSMTLDPTHSKYQIKIIQYNNIILYLLFFFILDLNEYQISSITHDKISSIEAFERFSVKLFGQEYKIKKSINGSEYVSILEYPVLSYLFYNLSYMLHKYKIWYQQTPGQLPVTQKIIIASLTDLINTSINVAGFVMKNIDEKVETFSNYSVYGRLTTTFYSSLSNLFKRNDLFEFIEKKQKNKNAKRSIKKENPSIYYALDAQKEYDAFMHEPKEIIKSVPAELKMNLKFHKDALPRAYSGINTITNCATGEFHVWKKIDMEIKCFICGEKIKGIKYGEKIDAKIVEKYYYKTQQKNAQHYCETTAQCDKKENFNNAEIDKIIADVRKNNQRMDDKKDNETSKILEKQKSLDKDMVIITKKIFDKYDRKYIDTFLDKLEKILGLNINLGSSKKPFYLRQNVYIIDHQSDGTSLNEPIVIESLSGKIKIMENHDFFKTDVLYYTDAKIGKLDVFYDQYTLYLLGVRKGSDYILFKSKDNRPSLKINYSIKHQIELMGHKNAFVRLSDIPVENVIRNRISVLKQIVYLFIQSFNTIKYSDNIGELVDIEKHDAFKNKMYESKKIYYNGLIFDFHKLLNGVVLTDVFDKWQHLERELYIEMKDFKFKKQIISFNDLNDFDGTGTKITYYLLSALTVMIDANDSFIKSNLANFIVKLIIYSRQITDKSFQISDIVLKRFEYIINGDESTVDVEKKGRTVENDEVVEHTDGLYDEYLTEEEFNSEKRNDKREKDKEREDALDVETMDPEEYDDEFQPDAE